MTTLIDLPEYKGTSAPPTAPSGGGVNSLDALYARNPGTVNATGGLISAPAQATAAQTRPSTTATAERAVATGAKATGFEALTQDTPDAELASSQLNKITSQDSPLIKRARQEGLVNANRRGLLNSSIAAGAAEGAIVDRATPLAQQNAQILQQQRLQNQTDTNRSREVSSGRETDVSVFNAGQSNDTSRLNAQLGTDIARRNADAADEMARLDAQMQTAVSQGNAELANQVRIRQAELQQQVNLENAAAQNRSREQVLAINADLNKQFLANTGAIDLATIQGRFEQLISSNATAGNLYSAYFNSIAQVMANKEIPPDRVAQSIQVQQQLLESGLRLIDQLNGLQLGSAIAGPTIVTSGQGAGTAITALPPGVSPTSAQGQAQTVQGTVRLGNADLPAGTTAKQVSGKPGGAGIYDVFDPSGNKIGILKPGGKNGIYVPNK